MNTSASSVQNLDCPNSEDQSLYRVLGDHEVVQAVDEVQLQNGLWKIAEAIIGLTVAEVRAKWTNVTSVRRAKPFVHDPARDVMLHSRKDLSGYLAAHPDIAALVTIRDQDSIGFTADVGLVARDERFDFPFSGEAFYEVLASSPIEGASQIGYTADRRAVWRREGEEPFVVVYDAKNRHYVSAVKDEDIVERCEPPKPWASFFPEGENR